MMEKGILRCWDVDELFFKFLNSNFLVQDSKSSHATWEVNLWIFEILVRFRKWNGQQQNWEDYKKMVGITYQGFWNGYRRKRTHATTFAILLSSLRRGNQLAKRVLRLTAKQLCCLLLQHQSSFPWFLMVIPVTTKVLFTHASPIQKRWGFGFLS
jgi:hypothetical protein